MAFVDDYDIRLLTDEAENRAAHTMFAGTLHRGLVSDERWAAVAGEYEPGRTWGAFAGGDLVGTAQSFTGAMVVPGGETLPMAMVSRVGVRADHTRRGVLTRMMRAQLGALTEPVATLRASEAGIYGRFGYGLASWGRTVRLDRRRARLRPEAPVGGRVRLLPLATALDTLPGLYERIGERRPGTAARPGAWWAAQHPAARLDHHVVVAVHSGPEGDDGFAVYHVSDERDGVSRRRVLRVEDLRAEPEAWAGLWRFLLGVDLVDDVEASLRPTDEPLEWLLADPRAVSVVRREDEVWLRLVDVLSALEARRFEDAGGSVVLEVADPLLPGNAGRFRVGDGPARRVSDEPGLSLGVDALGAVYLGGVAPSVLAGVGRLSVSDPKALVVADRLFATAQRPWCGTYF